MKDLSVRRTRCKSEILERLYKIEGIYEIIVAHYYRKNIKEKKVLYYHRLMKVRHAIFLLENAQEKNND